MRRLESLDGLRGFMLLLMMGNHLFFMNFSVWIDVTQYSYGLFGYVTAAEGFFFLSGFICAVAFSQRILQRADQVTMRLHSRAWELGRWHLVTLLFAACMVLLFPGLKEHFATNPFMKNFIESPFLTLILGIVMLALPPFLNILPLYMLFLWFTPWALRYLAKGHILPVLGISVGLWYLAQSGLWFSAYAELKTHWPHVPFDAGYFDPMAWQLLFVGGLISGTLLQQGRLAWGKKMGSLWLLPAIVCILLFLNKNQLLSFPWVWPKGASEVSQLGWLRLLNFIFLLLLIGLLLAQYPRLFAFRPLVFLGQHSLHVFVYHVIFLYATIGLKPWIESVGGVLGFAIYVGFLLSLWLPAWLNNQYRSHNAKELSNPIRGI